MTDDEMADAVGEVLEELPPNVRAALELHDVALLFRDDDELPGVLGVYQGLPLTVPQHLGPQYPQHIALWPARLRACCPDDDAALRALVRKVVLHEVGHFLGKDHPALARLGL